VANVIRTIPKPTEAAAVVRARDVVAGAGSLVNVSHACSVEVCEPSAFGVRVRQKHNELPALSGKSGRGEH
jgi:hypothetical protein